MDKSPDAFRTISEVAESLDTPAHVLRFWESRFPQIKPVKRAGGRRYYRPSDVALLTGIKRLLHDEGLTIRGVQKILRDQGVRHVAGLTDDSVGMDALLADAATADLIGEDVPEAGFIAIDDDAPEMSQPQPVAVRPSPKRAEQSVLPLFDTAFEAPPALARAEPPKPVAKKPTLRDDVTFASLIRRMSHETRFAAPGQIAEIARRIADHRAKLATRAEGRGS